MKKIVFAILVAGMFVGCTDGEVSKFRAIGDPGKITCYSGGTVIYDGVSTGAIGTEQQSDGWYFQEAGSGKLIRVSGACVIVN